MIDDIDIVAEELGFTRKELVTILTDQVARDHNYEVIALAETIVYRMPRAAITVYAEEAIRREEGLTFEMPKV